MNVFVLLKLMRTPGALNPFFEEWLLQDTVGADALFIDDIELLATPLITEVDMIVFEDGSAIMSEDDTMLITH